MTLNKKDRNFSERDLEHPHDQDRVDQVDRIMKKHGRPKTEAQMIADDEAIRRRVMASAFMCSIEDLHPMEGRYPTKGKDE